MKCIRSGGRMVYEMFYSREDNFLGWRCVFCGEIVDQMILEIDLGRNVNMPSF